MDDCDDYATRVCRMVNGGRNRSSRARRPHTMRWMYRRSFTTTTVGGDHSVGFLDQSSPSCEERPLDRYSDLTGRERWWPAKVKYFSIHGRRVRDEELCRVHIVNDIPAQYFFRQHAGCLR